MQSCIAHVFIVASAVAFQESVGAYDDGPADWRRHCLSLGDRSCRGAHARMAAAASRNVANGLNLEATEGASLSNTLLTAISNHPLPAYL